MRFATKVTGIKTENGKATGVILESGEQIDSEYVVLAVGREGSKWLNELFDKYQVPMTQTQVDIGVRVECSNLVMEEINKNLY